MHSLNIKVISVTFEVSKFDKSISVIFDNSLNIQLHDVIKASNFIVTLFVSNFKTHSLSFGQCSTSEPIISEGIGLKESDITFCFPFPLITKVISVISYVIKNKLKKMNIKPLIFYW